MTKENSFTTLTPGRLDRKIEFPGPTEEARARIMQIHARKMNISKDVNFDELARYKMEEVALGSFANVALCQRTRY